MSSRESGRWVIACINWGYEDAPHAALFRVGDDGYYDIELYVDTWADAVAAADRHVRRVVA